MEVELSGKGAVCLTQEQRRRMEESRKKAMEKLAQNKKRCAPKAPCSPPKSRPFPLASTGGCYGSVRSSTATSQRPPVAQAVTGGSGLQQTGGSGRQQTGGSGLQQTGGSGRQQTGGSGQQQTGGSGRQQIGGSGQQQTGSGRHQTAGSGRQQTGGSGLQQTGGSGWQQTGGSGLQQTGGSGLQQTGGSGRQQTGGSGLQQTGGSGLQQTGGSGLQQTGGSGRQQTGGSGLQQTGGSGLQQTGGSGRQQTVKADFVIVSKSHFKVLTPYDAQLVGIFKRIPSRIYDAKTHIWKFSLQDFNQLVVSVRNECSHVVLDLPPRPVVTAFTSGRQVDGVDGVVAGGGMDWSKMEAKIANGLMEFQKQGVEFAVSQAGRVLLADDMGLGKTVQAVAVACVYRQEWPLLVVCPSSVKLVWAEAFRHWVPTLREGDVNVVFSSSSKMTVDSLSAQVNVVSYDLAVRMAGVLKECSFQLVIADESHFLKNYKTARCKAILPLVKTARRALLLSGTPALSRPAELYTQMAAVDTSLNISFVDFGIRYCDGKRNPWGWDFSGASHLEELQLYLQQRVMIRRLKQEVLEQLPDKHRQMVAIEHLIPKGRELRQMQTQLNHASTLKQLEQRGALLSLYEWTANLKLPAIEEYVMDKLEGGQKMIVFGHHRSLINHLGTALESKKVGFIRIDGRTPSEERQALCDQFQHNAQTLVALLSITAANAGITLSAACTVVFAELFWNPGILVQAEDRAHRIGQKRCVSVHYLVARGTVDDFIWPLIQHKLEVLSQAGLAKADFSADSTVMRGPDQLTLDELLQFDADTPLPGVV